MATKGRGPTLYDVLEVDAGASGEEIEASYQRLVEHLGNDDIALYSILEDGEAERLRSQLDEAYRTLSDPERRAAYDRSHHTVQYPDVFVPSTQRGEASVTFGQMSPGQVGGGSTEADDNWQPVKEPASPPPVAVRAATVDARPIDAVPPVASAAVAPRRDSQGGAGRRRRLAPTLQLELNADTEFSGALLRRLRESAAASLEDVADLTKIGKHYLCAIEGNDFDALPAAVYVRGFVSEYARVLGLDPKLVSKSYMALYNRYREGGGKG